MSVEKFALNLLTSVIFGPLKYGTKVLIEPENRARNTTFLLTSLVGAGFIGDVVEAAVENGNDVVDSLTPKLPIDNNVLPDLSIEENALFVEALNKLLNEGIIPTINQDLIDSYHQETGVPFAMSEAYETDLGDIKGVFPVFKSVVEIELTESEYLLSDTEHFYIANKCLANNILSDQVTLSEIGLTEYDFNFLIIGETPPGYVWHHHQEAGILQLVEEEIHRNTGHTGGRELWGGGEQFR